MCLERKPPQTQGVGMEGEVFGVFCGVIRPGIPLHFCLILVQMYLPPYRVLYRTSNIRTSPPPPLLALLPVFFLLPLLGAIVHHIG